MDLTNPPGDIVTAINTARFLITLDNDGDPVNGITISSLVSEIALEEINFNQSLMAFEDAGSVQSTVAGLTTLTAKGPQPLLSLSTDTDNSNQWREYLAPIFGDTTVTLLALMYGDKRETDAFLCDFVRDNDPNLYNSDMQQQGFLNTTCCAVGTHSGHQACLY